MKKADDGTFSASVALPKNIPVEYKITRGSWETVEKNPDGSEMNNRTLTPADETTLDFEIGAWADKRPDRPADPPPAQPAAAAPVAPTTPAAPPAAPPPPPPAKIESTATGDIRTHRIHSRILDNNRSLYVWLPPGYSTNKDQKYAILYMHDGQNLFDRALNPVGEWQADETAARLIAEKKIQPLIIVGIANTALRMDEYTLTRDERMKAGGNVHPIRRRGGQTVHRSHLSYEDRPRSHWRRRVIAGRDDFVGDLPRASGDVRQMRRHLAVSLVEQRRHPSSPQH
jgi:hypothetical protein